MGEVEDMKGFVASSLRPISFLSQLLPWGLCQDSALSTTCCFIQDLPMGFPKERKNLNMDLVELRWTKVLKENVSVCT